MDLMPMNMLKMVTLLKKFKKMIKNIYKGRINRTQFVMYSLILVLIIDEITLLWNSSFEDIDEYFFIFSIFFTLLINARLHDIGEWILTPGKSNRVIPLFQRLLSKGDINENEYGKPPTTIKILNFYLN